MSITKKQMKFIDELFKDLNATQAAIRSGYSPRSARQIASKMLTKHDIQAEIERRMEASKMSANEVIYRIAHQARGLSPTKVTGRMGKQLAFWDQEEYDMLGALDRMGRYYALFTDKLVTESTMGLEIIDDEKG